jgi:hypothetical protein
MNQEKKHNIQWRKEVISPHKMHHIQNTHQKT